MNQSPESLRPFYDRAVAYISYLQSAGLLAQGREVSDFWADIFSDPDRKNYPAFDDMIRMRRGATFPLADPPDIDEETDRQSAVAAFSVFSLSVPPEFLRLVPESDLGMPRRFDVGGERLSAGAIVNSLTTYRIVEWIRKAGLSGKPLRILEIGAGYGQVAYQLCSLLDVHSYTILDLPENLFLSSYYLPASFPARTADFVKDEPTEEAKEGSFRFLVPSLSERLTGEFDVIINSYSFQEMPLTSVQKYFELASKHLSKGGLLYSLNSHGKSGVVKPSNYDAEMFSWKGLAPIRRFPHHYVLATTPYEVVLGRSEGSGRTQDPRHFDALGMLMQLGLFDDVVPLCDKFVAGTLSRAEQNWLLVAGRFFDSRKTEGKNHALDEMTRLGILSEVVAYLEGLVSFGQNNIGAAERILKECLPHFSGSFVDARISLILAACNAHRASQWVSRGSKLVPHLSGEIASYSRRPLDIRRHVSSEIGLAFKESSLRSLVSRVWRG